MNKYLFSHDDYQVLSRTIQELLRRGEDIPAAVYKLRAKLDQAVLPDTVGQPVSSVSLNSLVQVKDMENGEAEEWLVVMPSNANTDEGRISVFAPIGAAVIGAHEGDTVEWETPGGIRRWKVERIEQGAFKIPDLFELLYG